MPRPANSPDPLNDAQRDLAAAHVAFADTLAEIYSRRCPNQLEENRSAAYVGLCAAARGFDPASGVSFKSFAQHRIVGAIQDAARMELPCGFRRAKAAAPEVGSLTHVLATSDGGRRDGLEVGETLAADTLPVGWELESEDAVLVVTGRLSLSRRPVLRALFLRCDCTTQDSTARLVGITPSAVSFQLRDAVKFLRESTGACG